MNTRGRDRIRNNELDGTDWTSCWFHMDYFITECLFSIRLTSFQSRHFRYNSHVRVLSFRWVTVHFSDVFWRAAHGDGEDKEFFFQNHKVLLYSWVYTKKIDTSKFQLMYNTYLYDQNRRSIFNVFCTGLKKKRVGIAGDTARPIRVNIEVERTQKSAEAGCLLYFYFFTV